MKTSVSLFCTLVVGLWTSQVAKAKPPDLQCPVLEAQGVLDLDFNVAFCQVEEIDGVDSLLVTSFANVQNLPPAGPGQPPTPVVLNKDLVAVIRDLDALEQDPSLLETVVPEELTDLGVALPPEAETEWPNDAIFAAAGELFEGFDAIVIPQGFFTASRPGRLTAVSLNDDDRTEFLIHQSTVEQPRFYHQAVFYDVNQDGIPDIVTVRSGFWLFGPPGPPNPTAELVWFENPGPDNLDPAMPWTEHILVSGNATNGFDGPDVFIQMYDFEDDGIPEFVATQFFRGFVGFDAKITLYGAPIGGTWSDVNALDPNAPLPRTNQISNDELGRPFAVEIVDLNGDGRVDILTSNHQNLNDPVPGRVLALEQPGRGDIFGNAWTTHILLDNIQAQPEVNPDSPPRRLAPGFAIPIYPFVCNLRANRALRPWILLGGDEAGKVWLLQPDPKLDFVYDDEIIFDINKVFGPDTTQTVGTEPNAGLGAPPLGISISTIGRPAVKRSSKKNNGELIVYIPVFESTEIHVLRLFSDCSQT